jgi:hypothetical protein
MDTEPFYTRTVLGVTMLRLPLKLAELQAAIDYAEERKISDFSLHLCDGGPTVESLLPFASRIESLSVTGEGTFDPEVLTAFPNLRSFGSGVKKVRIDVARLPELRHFGGDWGRAVRLAEASKLRTVSLRGYNRADLHALELPRTVRRLELDFPGLKSLEGVEGLPPRLIRLEINYARRLEQVEVPDESSIEELWIYTSGKASYVPRTTSLRSLRLCNCAPIPTLSFLSSCHALEDFGFVGTRVVDKDLQPIVDQTSIRWVGMSNGRGYSHTEMQIDQALRLRGGYAVWQVDDPLGPYAPSLLADDD